MTDPTAHNLDRNRSYRFDYENQGNINSNVFNISGSTVDMWSDYMFDRGNDGIEGTIENIPCSAVPCVTEFQTISVAPYGNF